MILPILTSVVVRTFAWIVILGRQGIFNKLLGALGIVDALVNLLFTEPAVILVLAQVQMPLMVLPLLANLPMAAVLVVYLLNLLGRLRGARLYA